MKIDKMQQILQNIGLPNLCGLLLFVFHVGINAMIIFVFSEVKLTPQDIDRIVQTLKNFSGTNEEKDVLEDIDWVEGKRHSVY